MDFCQITSDNKHLVLTYYITCINTSIVTVNFSTQFLSSHMVTQDFVLFYKIHFVKYYRYVECQ